MTPDEDLMPLLFVARAVADALDGKPVDTTSLRAQLDASICDTDALGDALGVPQIEGARSVWSIAILGEELVAAVDLLEAGDPAGARTEIAEVLRRRRLT
jgi:hypothetical protein